MVYLCSFCSEKCPHLLKSSIFILGQERKALLENMLEAAEEWRYKGFIENLKENMELEVFEGIKHRIKSGNNEIDNRLITMNRYFFDINTKC